MAKKLTFHWQWLGFLLLIPSLIVNVFLFQKLPKGGGGIKVIGIIDGDTLVLEGKVKLRLRHVDAPELEFCGGKEAKEKLESLVQEKKVILKEQIIDQQGRPMALIYVKDKLVNEEMLKSGWARYHTDNSSQKTVLKAAYDLAKEMGLGIFSPQCYQKENPENPQCNIKGNIDKATRVKKYYFPGCTQYEFTIVEKDIGEEWFCTEEEAQEAGFEKSKTCFGRTYTP
jgi:micrococcal nuclease